MNNDPRIPILFDAEPREGDAVLVEDGYPLPEQGYVVRFSATKPGHRLSCVCCTLRGPVADALGRAFRDRATGAASFFTRVTVLASLPGQREVARIVEADAVVRARYRLVLAV